MGVSKNRGWPPKSSILIRFSINFNFLTSQFGGFTRCFRNIHMKKIAMMDPSMVNDLFGGHFSWDPFWWGSTLMKRINYGNFEGFSLDNPLFGLVSYNDHCRLWWFQLPGNCPMGPLETAGHLFDWMMFLFPFCKICDSCLEGMVIVCIDNSDEKAPKVWHWHCSHRVLM